MKEIGQSNPSWFGWNWSFKNDGSMEPYEGPLSGGSVWEGESAPPPIPRLAKILWGFSALCYIGALLVAFGVGSTLVALIPFGCTALPLALLGVCFVLILLGFLVQIPPKAPPSH